MKLNSFLFLSVVITLMFNNAIVYAGPHWTHEEQMEWGAIEDPEQVVVPDIYPYAQCSIGRHQSPVDLAKAEINRTRNLNQLRIWYDVDAPTFYNSGHGVQVNTSLDYLGHLEIGEEVYPLIQFHFHEPSEHVIGEKRFPAELHFVHVRDDGRIVVMAVAIEEGEENEAFQVILDNTPYQAGEQNENTGLLIDPVSLLPSKYHKPDFYTFAGSLTTPPCSEGVQWYLLSEAITVSAAQLEHLKGFYTNNVRFPQELNGRAVSTTE